MLRPIIPWLFGFLGGFLGLNLALLAAPVLNAPATSSSASFARDRTQPLSSLEAPALHEVVIQLTDADEANLRRDPRRYVPAKLRIETNTFERVGVHLKGSRGSFQSFDDKPSLTIDLGRFGSSQSYRGITKFHLNNSAEDPGYLNEYMASQWFRAAGLAAPDVGHARVRLGPRRLGIYVLKEAFDGGFQSRELGSAQGIMLEPVRGSDVDGKMRVLGKADHTTGQLDRITRLADAANESDPQRRWDQLSSLLDVDRFARFMATEVLLGHRDGYSLARNNYRLYLPPTNSTVLFLPQGMDQILERPAATWRPSMAGLVAQAWMKTPSGRERYEAALRTLYPQILNPQTMASTLNTLSERLESHLKPGEHREFRRACRELQKRAAERAVSLDQQLNGPPVRALSFSNNVAVLKDWETSLQPSHGKTELQYLSTEGKVLLHATADGGVVSWRSNLWLMPGQYRLSGRVRTRGVRPLEFGKNHGAYMRVAGTRFRTTALLGSADWKPIAVTFDVPTEDVKTDAAVAVTLHLELRAKSGDAWFDRDSLELERLSHAP